MSLRKCATLATLLSLTMLTTSCDLINQLFPPNLPVISGTITLSASVPAGHKVVAMIGTTDDLFATPITGSPFLSQVITITPGGTGDFSFTVNPGSYSMGAYYDVNDDGNYQIGELAGASSGLPGRLFSVANGDHIGLNFGVTKAFHSVIYNGNGSTGGGVPVDSAWWLEGSSAVVLGNPGNLFKTGFTFGGWNTQADGGGTTYAPGGNLVIGAADVTLYALWTSTTPAVSSNVSSPSVLSIDSLTTFSIANNTTGYVAFSTSSSNGYGVYVTPTAALSLYTGYFSSGWVQNGVGSVNPTGYELRQGFKAGSANYGAEIDNYSGGEATFDIIVREGVLGASSLNTPVSLSLATPTWIAAGSNTSDFSFVAAGTTATLQFDTLTAGLDVEILSQDRSTSIFGPTVDGSESQVTKTVSVTGLANGVTYVLRVTTHVTGTSGASVGKLTISSP